MRKIDLTNKRFGRLIAIKPTKKRTGSGCVIWRCDCDCGNITFVSSYNLRLGGTKSCSCIQKEVVAKRSTIDIEGKRFGRLTAIRPTKKRSSEGSIVWKFRCDCGNITFASTKKVRCGDIRSCGCRRNLHSRTKTSEYKIWVTMKQRCYNKNATGYKNYGGRDIKVCKRWRNSFINFLEDMGERPSPKFTIERVGNNDNYTSLNCKWATRTEQANNRRK